MDLLEKYLQAVRSLLPRRSQDDIVRELSENLRSQIEDKEDALGRALTEAELVEIVRRHGHPLVVAGRYRSNRQLIGAGLFPFYLFVLKAGLAAALAVTVLNAALSAAMHGAGGQRLLEGLLAYPGRALMVFAWTTLVFAMFDLVQAKMKLTHAWDPRKLPRLVRHCDRMSRWNSLCEVLTSVAFLAWLLLLPGRPYLLLGPLHTLVHPAPVWTTLYAPIVLMFLGTLTLSTTNVMWPYRTTARSLARLGVHLLAFAIFVALARADAWVVAAPGVDQAAVAGMLSTINTGVSIGLWIAAGASVIEMLQELRRWQSWRKVTLSTA